MGVTLKYPSTGTATNSVSLPFPAHVQAVEFGRNQTVGRTPSGTPYVASHGEPWYRVTRTFESLSEEIVNDVVDLLSLVNYTAGELAYEYVDASTGSTVSVPCRVVGDPSGVKQFRGVRDIALVFEQRVHPDHESDGGATPDGSYGGGTIGSGTPDEPIITSLLAAAAAVGDAFSYTITADGAATITFGASGLPSWLSRTGAVLSGTPADGDEGQVEVTITATNSDGSDSQTLTITVEAAETTATEVEFPPTFRPPIAFTVYEEFPTTIELVCEGTRPMEFTSGDLPGWLTLDDETGELTGTVPDEPSPAEITFTVTAENDLDSDSQVITVTMVEPTAPEITSSGGPIEVEPGDLDSHTITATGTGPLTFTVEDTLPDWIFFDDEDTIHVRPQPDIADQVQTVVLTIRATNPAGDYDEEDLTVQLGVPAEILTVEDDTFTLNVDDGPLVIDFTYEGTEPVLVSLDGEPSFVTLDYEDGSGTLTFEPEGSDAQASAYTFDLEATNVAIGGALDTHGFTVTITVTAASITSDPTGSVGAPAYTGSNATLIVFKWTGTEVTPTLTGDVQPGMSIVGPSGLPGDPPLPDPANSYIRVAIASTGGPYNVAVEVDNSGLYGGATDTSTTCAITVV